MALSLALFLNLLAFCLGTSYQPDPEIENLITSLLNADLQTDCVHPSYQCVVYFQCVDGVINTDGSGLIDVRTKPPATCVNNEYPGVPAVCCLKPGETGIPPPVDICPENQACVELFQCSEEGYIVTDGSGLINIRTGFTSCRLGSGRSGRCCRRPSPFVDTCPGKAVCQPGPTCKGQALDALHEFIDYVPSGLWSRCSYGQHDDGVCCQPPADLIYDVCPGDSVCLSHHDCKGTALDNHNSFHDFVAGGSWAHCTNYDQGVCCINPVVIPNLPTAGHCGYRNYQDSKKSKVDVRITSTPYDLNREAAFGEFPWQAIIFYANYTFKCGASLISDRHLLTAAHCVKGLHPSEIRIRLGEYQVNDFNEPLPYIDKDVHFIYTHPFFNPKNLHYDISVLELHEPVHFQYHINSICLPKVSYVPEPRWTCVTTGWGKDAFNGSFQRILKKVAVPFIHQEECQYLLRKTRLGKFFNLDPTFVCAGGEKNEDACYGDGGGPLVCKDPVTNRYILAGITAWGIGCGLQDVPGVYVNVAYFTDWVHEVIEGGLDNAVGYGTN